MTAFVDTNVLVRHLTGDPPEQARRATQLLASAEALLLTDIVLAELVYVLESVYELSAPRVAELARSVVLFPRILVLGERHLLRALELYELDGLHFAAADLVASAEVTGVGAVASFDRAIDRVGSVQRFEP